jgi:predicted transcriptional regulator
MSSKEIAIDVIRKLPDEASLLEIAHELEFVAGIREGTEQLDKGDYLSAEEIRKRIPEWAKHTK